jgi:Arabinose-binding domain of AraC transcription regulator, N-term
LEPAGARQRRTRPTISLTVATGLIEAVVAAGANPDEVLRAVGLDRSALSSPRGFIACADFTRLLEAPAQATGDDYTTFSPFHSTLSFSFIALAVASFTSSAREEFA